MNTRPFAIPLLALGIALASAAMPAAAQSDAPAVPCSGDACAKFKHRLTYPAHALSYAPAAAFALHQRGVNWLGGTGMMSLTIHRPADYKGGPVRISLFHEVLSDEAGDLEFVITPVGLNHGNSFETYISHATNNRAAPLTLTILYEQSALIPPGNGFNPGSDWWYFDIVRQGAFTGPLRLMSIAIDY